MGHIRGRVLDIGRRGNTQLAYLYGFRVDHSELRQGHKTWLRENLLDEAKRQHGQRPPWPRIWHVFASGTASRTGKADYNVALSKRRADVVLAHIATEFTRQSMPSSFYPHPFWVGETAAAQRGVRDNIESPLDRAVLVAIQPADPDIPVDPPAPVSRDPRWTNPCCAVQQELDFTEAVLEIYMHILAKGRPGSVPQHSFSGIPYDPLDVPRESLGTLEESFVQRWLHQKGWSWARAKELSRDTQYCITRIDGLETHINWLTDRIINLKRDLNNCSPHDDMNICQTGKFRKEYRGDADTPEEYRTGKTIWESDDGFDQDNKETIIVTTNSGAPGASDPSKSK